jgi:hypothetical protein
MLSSADLAEKIRFLESNGSMARETKVMIFGDQAFGSSIPFYLGEPIVLVDGRSTSMLFGSTFADAPKVFETSGEMLAGWGTGQRKVLFVPLEQRDRVDALLRGRPQVVLAEMSGKALITDRGLDR